MLFLVAIFANSVLSQEKVEFAEFCAPYMTISPTISKLQRLEPDSIPHELNKLWTKIKNEGSPLIEKDPLNDDYLYMTLIYQDSTKNKDVSFEVIGIYDEYRLGDMKMHWLKNTDLYYRC